MCRFRWIVLSGMFAVFSAHGLGLPPPVGSERLTDAQALAVIDFWTPERLQEAWDLPSFPSTPLAPVIGIGTDGLGYTPAAGPYQSHADTRAVGILVVRQPDAGNTLGHCSASIIKSGSESLIVTAAHCVSSGAGWFDNIMFIPAFQAGGADGQSAVFPLGRWPVQQAFIPWMGASNTSGEDVAVARVIMHSVSSLPDLCTSACTLQSVAGSGFEPQISLQELPTLIAILGYPAKNHQSAPYPFASMRYCMGRGEHDEPSTAIRLPGCATVAGNSGGPLVALDPHADGARQVWGVVHDTISHARLKASTFLPAFEVADSAW